MRILLIFITILITISCSLSSIAVAIEQTLKQNQKETYIPENLNDCFTELKKILEPEEILKMKKGTEKNMNLYHFGLGMWIRNNWGLWKESQLKKYFNNLGIYHPDDMSGIILVSFWRHLNNKPINLDTQVKAYQEYWKKQNH